MHLVFHFKLDPDPNSVPKPSVQDLDPYVFGPGGSASGSVSQKHEFGFGSGYGSGSFPFLIKVLSGLKYWFQNKMLVQNFIFYQLTILKLLNFKYVKIEFVCILSH